MTGVTTRDEQWWNAKKRGQAAAPLVFSLFETIKQRQIVLLTNTRQTICIYQWGYKAGESQNPEAEAPFNDDVVGSNVAQNTVDTMHAKLCATRVVPMPLTDGGSYLERRRAREMGKALDGEWDENDVEAVWEDVCLDALITCHGAGAAKVFPKGKGRKERVCVEHTPIDDLFFDPAEVRQRKPRSLIQRQRMDRFVALAEFGKEGEGLEGTASQRRDAILAAPEVVSDAGEPVEANQIEVVEMWHLPSEEPDDEEGEEGAESETDGRHFIGIADCDFVDEEYRDDRFPFMLFVPRRRARHVLGLSLMWNLAAPQREYEKMSYRFQKAHHRMGGTHIYLPRNSNVNTREIDNGQGTIIEGDDTNPPKEFNPTPVNPQSYEYREGIARDMVTKNGMSEMATSSQVPAGLSQASGKALQVFEDSEDKRLVVPHRAKERFMCGLAWLIVECARGIAERNPQYRARYRGKKAVEPILWKEVLLDRGRFVLKVMPAGPLSKQPSAKFEQLTEMLNAGAITIEQFKREFGIPDLDAELELDSADTDIIDYTLDKIVTTGKYISPEPFDDFALAKTRCAKFINLCRKNDVPDDRIRLLHDFWEDTDALEQQAKAKALAAAAPPPGAGSPPGMPPPPPGTPGALDVPGIPPMPDQPMMPPVAA